MADLAAGAVAPAAVEEHQVGGNALTKLTGIATLKGQYLGRRYFTKEFLAEISALITEAERDHQAELVVAIERKFPEHLEVTRDRAFEVFGRLKVWDTPLNTGLLLYLSLDRQAIEIIADRGIAVDNEQWVEISNVLVTYFKNKQFREGLVEAVRLIEEVLQKSCPQCTDGDGEDYLPNTPVIL
ncbi:TPM domain-containing protein [Oligella ureolytica]|uniref:TPM domain-containing protein n=1 Tax=Oligella ureolytica TaxID=90244 RepID=UPI00215D8B8E|nr:TPM domain-containing protein [Oligella ureolytica]